MRKPFDFHPFTGNTRPLLVTRSLIRAIYDLAWPVLIAQLAVMAYAVIDTLMAGRFATEDLAAVGIGASIYFSVFVALMGVLLAVSPTSRSSSARAGTARSASRCARRCGLRCCSAVLSVVDLPLSRSAAAR